MEYVYPTSEILILYLILFFFLFQTAQSFGGIGFGIKREIFFLNLEDGYFGCQVNESTDVLQLFELSKLCDGTPNCYLGSDELTKELKCTGKPKKRLLIIVFLNAYWINSISKAQVINAHLNKREKTCSLTVYTHRENLFYRALRDHKRNKSE